MKKWTIALLAGAAVVGVGGLALAQQGYVPPPKVSMTAQAQPIPFELFRGNRVVITSTLNGHRAETILDTGAGVTTVDRTFARSIGLPVGQKITAQGAGGAVEAELVSDVTLEISGMRFEKMTVAVMDLGPVARGIGHPMNVVLGREFFNSAVISIDWAASQLRVRPHSAFAPGSAATALELKRRGPFNTIPISIAGGEPIEALLDLGNGGALSIPRSYWGKRADLSALRYAEGRRGGVGGLHPARNATIPQVALAGKTFANVPATMSEGGNDHEPQLMTNVGIGLLKQFHVDLDLGRDRIYLAPLANPPEFERDRSGARADLHGDRLKVAFVSPQGPAAAAGLKAGDEIVAVDGRRITPDFYQAADWARGAPGSKVRLERADGTTVTVTLQDYY
ncbi:MAG TPA: aspartyl protease family protein [Sphingomicrobium sp.]